MTVLFVGVMFFKEAGTKKEGLTVAMIRTGYGFGALLTMVVCAFIVSACGGDSREDAESGGEATKEETNREKTNKEKTNKESAKTQPKSSPQPKPQQQQPPPQPQQQQPPPQQQQPVQQQDPRNLSCPELTTLYRRYNSIADGAIKGSAGGGDSPASAIAGMQGIQAVNKAQEILGIMNAKGCSVPRR